MGTTTTATPKPTEALTSTSIFEECKGLTGLELTLCEQKHTPEECVGLTGHNLEHCVKYMQGEYLPECESSPYLHLCRTRTHDSEDDQGQANKITEPKTKYTAEKVATKDELIQEGVDAIFKTLNFSSKAIL